MNDFIVDMSKYESSKRFSCQIGFMDKITIKDFLEPHKIYEGEEICNLLNELNVIVESKDAINMRQQKQIKRLDNKVKELEGGD